MPSVTTAFRFSITLLALAYSASSFGQTATTNRSVSPTLVVLIGGMDSDPTPQQMSGTAKRSGNSGLYRLRGDLQHPGIIAEYFNWNGSRAGKLKTRDKSDSTSICDVIRAHAKQFPCSRIIIVGNSWGGHTTWEVCRDLVESPAPVAVDYVVFLDPSSAGRANTSRPKNLPININRATNIYTRNIFGWRNWPQEERIENIDLGDPDQGYLTKGGPAYNATFDFSAHVAAEWDELIHAAIKRRILDLAPTP